MPTVGEGPPWSYDEADRRAREFLDALTGDREFDDDEADPVEFARANGLMILFGAEEQAAFSTYLDRMPAPRAEAWRELISGGASSEAFGPLTLREKLDEKQVTEALDAGRRQRLVNVGLGAAAVVVVVAVVTTAWFVLGSSGERSQAGLVFDEVDDTDPVQAAVSGGPPVPEPELTEPVDLAVAVEAGAGEPADRVVTAPFTDHRYAPGALHASLFQYAASGQVMVVGPEGFVDDVCLRASVVTSELRPLDTVWYGDCTDPVGRQATVGCLGPTAVLLAVDVPPAGVTLPEGGTGFADAVRVQSITEDDDYEVLTVRTTIGVPVDSDIVIPRFGGERGDELTFDLAADRVGTCTLTGDLPTR